MTDAITLNPTSTSSRALQMPQPEIKAGAFEAPALDPETRSRLLQLGHLARGARTAAANQILLSRELATTGLGTVNPPPLDVLTDAVAMEEFNRKKQKEANLSTALQGALVQSERTQGELHRAALFLLPQIDLEDEEGVTTPGFTSPMKSPEVDAGGLIWDSHADFYAQISALLGVLQTEWLSKYQHALSNYLEFYKEFADIMEKITVAPEGDKGNVKIEFGYVVGELRKLMEKYKLQEGALAQFPSEEAAEAFKESLGLPGMKVMVFADGSWGVLMDTDPLSDLILSMPLTAYWDAAQYNAWLSSKDSNMEQIKHVSKVLGEKLSEMTQKYDNIVKILSSTIDKITEADMSFVHGI
ncbi:IpaD/SipD/SspD family type III secretion system needle tip protein [uncultured Stenotrophomonas sp.]|uniref:IpaD/SipD/SspD family type III secretion system needle tip protein n=1 Tax=uncultured Stenotrophomonas sp. TaxID=165438 RepID=UPI0028E6A40A|nr:IpaD/SipD/SspD family type III secretion system needle tip protein [uncultured Stenotrophomonas sp.]